MIDFEQFTLDNGLKVIVNSDFTTNLVAMNILYKVGSRDEDPSRTGFAHLFEHLMFGGSVNIPRYDTPLEKVGGENNAFTSNDITNYYLTVPWQNLETAFWLESDRMLGLAFSEKSLQVQKKVVAEEFKQRYLNQPYGDAWLLMRPLAYKVHPYQWPTIGKELSHIENAGMQEVRDFYEKYYHPSNAVLCLSGHVDTDTVKKLSEKWFGPIRKNAPQKNGYPAEPPQKEERELAVTRDVPFDMIYMAYHMAPRTDPSFYAADMLAEVLSGGESSRLYQELVKNQNLFSEIDAYLTGDMDPGLFILSGRLMKGVAMEKAVHAILEETGKVMNDLVEEQELQKIKNKTESLLAFSEMKVSSRAMNLCLADLMGDPGLINTEISKYLAVTAEEIREQACRVFRENNRSMLYYLAGVSPRN